MDKPENKPREGEDEPEINSGEEFHHAMEDDEAANTGRNPSL